MTLACYMCSDPRFSDGKTVLLLMGSGLLAFALSPASHGMTAKTKRRVLLALPTAVWVVWFLVQRELLLTGPIMRSFYRSMWGQTAWKLNSAVLLAFGLAFSVAILRTAGLRYRIYGALCFIAYLPLLLGFSAIGPVGSTQGLRYRLDAWMHPSVTEPVAGGKPLSYWARRVNDTADQSEPALNAIHSMGGPGVEALIGEFRTGEGFWSKGQRRPHPWEVRQYAANALVKLGPDAAPAVPLMVKSLQSSDRTIREQAANVIGVSGDASPSTVSALIRVLAHDDTAYDAMRALAQLAAKEPTIVGQLAAAVKGPNSEAAY